MQSVKKKKIFLEYKVIFKVLQIFHGMLVQTTRGQAISNVKFNACLFQK